MDKAKSSDNNIEQKQVFKSTSILSLLALIVAILLIFGPAWHGVSDLNREKSITKAQSLAYQVVALESKKRALAANSSNSISQKSRSPASSEPASGVMGSDPWGQPYFYKVRHEGEQTFVDVWTTGVNAIKTQVLIPDGYL